MIYIADISSIGVQHEQFNKSFIELTLLAHLSESVVFLADKSHLNVMAIDNRNIQTKEIDVYGKRGGLKEFIRAYYQFRCLMKIVGKADKEGINNVYVLLIHPFAHFLFKVFGGKNVPISIVMHGELESIKFNKHFLNKIWGIFLKKAISIQRSNVRYIILGESIYENLLKVLPSFSFQKAIVLDHPYPFEKQFGKEKNLERTVFSTLGVATVAKNSQYFFELAKKSSESGLNYKFNICGRVYKNMERFLNGAVNYKSNFESLTRLELNALLLETDFAVFYYDNENYSLCSSGAFWDAINAEIPLLYVSNDYFDYYASIVGEVGISFDTPEKLNEYILRTDEIKSLLSDNYSKFVNNIRSLKYRYMTAENLSRQLVSER